jgi:hypothetical protein
MTRKPTKPVNPRDVFMKAQGFANAAQHLTDSEMPIEQRMMVVVPIITLSSLGNTNGGITSSICSIDWRSKPRGSC